MSMIINHNMDAIRALSVVTDNGYVLSKNLKKISSGVNIADATDDTSGYAISARMRAMIRAINQNIRNTQTGNSLLKIAEDATQNIIDELRNLKELSLNACNDTNTDEDREVLQKVFAERIANIDDIATSVNYNGKVLLDGRFAKKNNTERETQTYLDTKKILLSSNEIHESNTTYSENILKDLGNTSVSRVSTDVSDVTITTGDHVDFDGNEESIPFDKIKTVVNNISVVEDVTEDHNVSESVVEPYDNNYNNANVEALKSDLKTAYNIKTLIDGNVVEERNEEYTLTETTTYESTTVNESGAEFADTWQTQKISEDLVEEITYLPSTRFQEVEAVEVTKPADGTLNITSSSIDGISDPSAAMGANGIVIKLAEGFSGTINISASSPVTIIGNGTHKNTYINMTGDASELYIKDLNISNSVDKSAITFGSNASVLHLLGNNKIDAYAQSYYKAAIKVGSGGLTVAGEGSLDLRMSASTFISGAAIGTDRNGSCGDITIDGNLTVNRTLSPPSSFYGTCEMYGTSIGGGMNGTCGKINFNSNANVTINQKISYTDAVIYDPGIGSGFYGKCEGINIYSGSTLNVSLYAKKGMSQLSYTGVYAPCIGNGSYVKGLNIYVYEGSSVSGSNPGVTRGDGSSLYHGEILGSAGYNGNRSTVIRVNETKFTDDIPEIDPTVGNVEIQGYKMQTKSYTRTSTETVDHLHKWQILNQNETVDTQTITNVYSVHDKFTTIYKNKTNMSDGLYIHHGTKANQTLCVNLGDMRVVALGLNNVSLINREKAAEAINIIEDAIEYSLNEITNIGANINRLEYTETNLVTAGENLQAAESNIRDANVASEMTLYAKNNLILKASQSMLAQANQNSSAVLGLLQ